MKSADLKQAHKKVYEAFFANYQKVFSAPLCLNRAGDRSPTYNGLNIKQKLPLRIYIGMRKTDRKKITINTITSFQFEEQSFATHKAIEYLPYIHDLHLRLDQQSVSWGGSGYVFDILSEVPRSVGLWYDGIVCALIQTAVMSLSGSITSHMIQTSSLTINEYLSNEHLPMYHLIQWALELEEHLYQTHYNSSIIASVLNGAYPIISFANDYSDIQIQHTLHKRYYGYRFEELLPHLSPHPYSPVDFGIFYTWRPAIQEQINHALKSSTTHIQTIKDQLQDFFGNQLKIEVPLRRPLFYKQYLDQEDRLGGHLMDYADILWSLSLELAYALQKIYQKGYSDQDIKYLISIVIKTRYSHNVSRETSAHTFKLVRDSHNAFSDSPKSIGLNYCDTNVSGWCLYFVTPHIGFRSHIANMYAGISNKDKSIAMIYMNRQDGYEYPWLQCEQDVSIHLYPERIQQTAYQLITLDGETIVWWYDDLLESYHGDILMDMVKMKLTISWKPLSSKDLHSQSATIEILSYLLDHIGEYVTSPQLPQSSYTKSKTEFQWKIIWPLCALIEKTLGIVLPITIEWTGRRFSVKIDRILCSMGILSVKK